MEGETLPAAPSKNRKKRSASAGPGENDKEGSETTSAKKAKTASKSGTPTARQRKAPAKGVLKSTAMPRNFDLCEEHDKMLIEWKESGRTWEDIRKKWREITGGDTAVSTLPNRYSRLKSNFVVIKEEHNALLLEAKQAVEASFEHDKWHLVAKAMQDKGADKYEPAELHRQYKNLMKFGLELKTDRPRGVQPVDGELSGTVEMQDV